MKTKKKISFVFSLNIEHNPKQNSIFALV